MHIDTVYRPILLFNTQYLQALYQKAEALFFNCEYERALVLYERGRRHRPNMTEFSAGAIKARQAIASQYQTLRTYT